jgi:hypothetical protein
MSSDWCDRRADQARDHVVLQIADHRQFAAVERGVANARQSLIGFDLERDEVAGPGQTITRALVIFMQVSG